jgi:hypothetical protein
MLNGMYGIHHITPTYTTSRAVRSQNEPHTHISHINLYPDIP